MVDQVDLSSAVRTGLTALQRTTGLGAQADARLSSGVKVASPEDGAASFFQAQALNSRAADLNTAKDSVDQAVSTIQAAQVGLSAIGKLAEQARGLAVAARNTSDPAARAALAEQFNAVAGQIDGIARDSGFNGTNLIGNSQDDLDVALNEDGSSTFAVAGTDSTSAGLGFAPATFASDADVEAAIAQAEGAEARTRTNAATLASGVSSLQTRIDFTRNLSNTLEQGAAGLTNADLTEEAANRLAASSRQQIGQNALSLTVASERSILSLFS